MNTILNSPKPVTGNLPLERQASTSSALETNAPPSRVEEPLLRAEASGGTAIPKPAVAFVALHHAYLDDVDVVRQLTDKIGHQVAFTVDIAAIKRMPPPKRAVLVLTAACEEEVNLSPDHWLPHLEQMLALAPTSRVLPLSATGAARDVILGLGEYVEEVKRRKEASGPEFEF